MKNERLRMSEGHIRLRRLRRRDMSQTSLSFLKENR